MRKTITSISEYIELIESIAKENEHSGNKADIIFRGQPLDRTLLPKLARLTPRGEIDKIEKLMLEDFKRSSYPLTEYKTENAWDLLALAQHHGLPTRLLDWSYSALIALWFAVCEPLRNQETGVVWILNGEIKDFIHESLLESKDPLSNEIIGIFRSKVVTRRISAQAGLFTIHKIENGEIKSLETDDAYGKKLIKVSIETNSVPAIRKQLQTLGINYSTVFPDIDGLCKHLAWRYSRYSDEDATSKGKLVSYTIY